MAFFLPCFRSRVSSLLLFDTQAFTHTYRLLTPHSFQFLLNLISIWTLEYSYSFPLFFRHIIFRKIDLFILLGFNRHNLIQLFAKDSFRISHPFTPLLPPLLLDFGLFADGCQNNRFFIIYQFMKESDKANFSINYN